MIMKIKLPCVVFHAKKTVRVLPRLNSGNVPVIKSQVVQSFVATITTSAEIEKKQKLKPVRRTSLQHQLSNRGKFITKRSTPTKFTEVLLRKCRQL